jgi:hypothetical protein
MRKAMKVIIMGLFKILSSSNLVGLRNLELLSLIASGLITEEEHDRMSLASSRSNMKNCFMDVINMSLHIKLGWFTTYHTHIQSWMLDGSYIKLIHKKGYMPLVMMVIYILAVSWMTSLMCTKKMMISHLLLP